MPHPVHLELVLKNTLEEKQRVAPFLREFAREQGIQREIIQALDLALEEHLTNVLSYAYGDQCSHEIIIRLTVCQNWLEAEVVDDGRPFDPLEQPPADTSLPLEQKPVGGLGIHLIRKLMDDVSYARESARNTLRLRKRIEPNPS